MSDKELLDEINSLLALSSNLPFQSTVTKIANKSNQFYSSSGLLLLQASKSLLAYREEVAARLIKNNYSVESQELHDYTPHITIRLGVPLKGGILKQAQESLNAKVISFNQWMLFRLVLVDGKRTMREIRPN